jgi:hypothetical protein
LLSLAEDLVILTPRAWAGRRGVLFPVILSNVLSVVMGKETKLWELIIAQFVDLFQPLIPFA